MNCTICKAEWTPPEGVTITNCPFCGKSLIKLNEISKDGEPHQILFQIVRQFGRPIIGETRLKGIIADFMPQVDKKYINIFVKAINDKIAIKILALENEEASLRTIQLDNLKNSFKTNNGFSNSADYIFDSFLYALNMVNHVDIESYERDDTDSADLFNKQIELAFVDGLLSKEESNSIFESGEILGIPEHEVVSIIRQRILRDNFVPKLGVQVEIINAKRIICSQDWYLDDITINSAKDYRSVTIGKQVWMAVNLNVDRFQNGDKIPQVQNAEKWREADKNEQPAWCYYENDTYNGKIYGKLYNWWAVIDKRGLAPKGWHVPSIEEWNELIKCCIFENNNSVDISEIDLIFKKKSKSRQDLDESLKNHKNDDFTLQNVGLHIKAIKGWNDNRKNMDNYGFSALPAGMRKDFGGFEKIENECFWWSTTEKSSYYAYAKKIWLEDLWDFSNTKGTGLSVRCVKN